MIDQAEVWDLKLIFLLHRVCLSIMKSGNETQGTPLQFLVGHLL